MQTFEFLPGSLVTFKPYEEALPAKVLRAEWGHMTALGSGPQEAIYVLTDAPGAKKSVNSVTSGRSIVESKLYEEYDPIRHGFGSTE